MVKPRVLIIKTGGTIAQKLNAAEVYEPCSDDYLAKVEGLEELAELDVLDLGNIDSTNMETNLTFTLSREEEKKKDRADFARAIYEQAYRYDGYVGIHGTDTMPETAAALTYMLPDFRKPIVLTGAQRSIWSHRSDGGNNIYTAVQAATKDFGEVIIAFGNGILRGTRARKIDEEGYDAFYTPGIEPLGKVTSLKEGIRLMDHRIRRADFDARLFTDFDTCIFHYAHISGSTIDEVLVDVACNEKVHGFLLGGFGAGNIPDRLLPFIRSAISHEKPVLVYTRCERGAADMGIYSVGVAPLEAGAQPAGDMTFEALGQKLMYALGRAASEHLRGRERSQFVETIIRRPYNGDITVMQKRR